MGFYHRDNESHPDYFNDLEQVVQRDVQRALEEDTAQSDGGSDITAELIPEDTSVTAKLIARENGLLCGSAWFEYCFTSLDDNIQIDWNVAEGARFSNDDVLCTIIGNARVILTAERSGLNFLQTLSGTASATAHYADMIKHTSCRLLDTRKTIPGLRIAQKYAVYCGGGSNHRIGLYDAYLIKENHICACGGIHAAVATAKLNYPGKTIEVEVETLDELKTAIESGADIVMLDNFSTADKVSAVELNQRQAKLEASGDINSATIIEVAETGVDFISVGAITKHVRATDFSLLIQET